MNQPGLPLDCNPENEANLRAVFEKSGLKELGYTYERAVQNDAMFICLLNLSEAVTRKPVSYSPPVEKVCGYCGVKHTGPFNACDSCKSAADRGA